MNKINHIVVSVIVLAVQPQYNVSMHATGLISVARIRVASTNKTIHRG